MREQQGVNERARPLERPGDRRVPHDVARGVARALGDYPPAVSLAEDPVVVAVVGREHDARARVRREVEVDVPVEALERHFRVRHLGPGRSGA